MFNLPEDPLPKGGRWVMSDEAKRHLEHLAHWRTQRADKARYQRGYILMGGFWIHKDRSMAEQRAYDAGLLD